MHTGEWIRERRTGSGQQQPPKRPARCRSTGDISTSDYHVRRARKERRQQIFDPFRRVAEVCIHHEKNFPLCGERTRHNGGSQSKLCVILLD